MMRQSTSASPTRTAALAAVICVALGLLAVPAGATAPGSKWSVRATPAVTDYPVRSVSCVGADCMAIASACSPGGCGGLLPGKTFVSSNMGTSWHLATFPGTAGDPSPVTCGGPKFCIVTATRGPLGPAEVQAILVTVNDGASWAIHIAPHLTLGALACASASSCVVLATSTKGPETLRTTTSGRSWSASPFPPNRGYVEAAWCTGPTSCVAVGSNLAGTAGIAFVSSNVGKSWRQVGVPATIGPMRSISCTERTCMALGATQVMISRNGGSSWAAHPLPPGPRLEAGSCLTATECVLVGGGLTNPGYPVAERSTNGGASWAVQSLPRTPGLLASAACSSKGCVAVGDRVLYSGAVATHFLPLVMTS